MDLGIKEPQYEREKNSPTSEFCELVNSGRFEGIFSKSSEVEKVISARMPTLEEQMVARGASAHDVANCYVVIVDIHGKQMVMDVVVKRHRREEKADNEFERHSRLQKQGFKTLPLVGKIKSTKYRNPEDNYSYILTEYVQGLVTLDRINWEESGGTASFVQEYGKAADELARLHFVYQTPHYDLQPKNVGVTPKGETYIFDLESGASEKDKALFMEEGAYLQDLYQMIQHTRNPFSWRRRSTNQIYADKFYDTLISHFLHRYYDEVQRLMRSGAVQYAPNQSSDRYNLANKYETFELFLEAFLKFAKAKAANHHFVSLLESHLNNSQDVG